jgi:hypothetical protein
MYRSCRSPVFARWPFKIPVTQFATESSTQASADNEWFTQRVIGGGGHGRPLERNVGDGNRMIDPVERHLRQSEYFLQPFRLYLHRSR